MPGKTFHIYITNGRKNAMNRQTLLETGLRLERAPRFESAVAPTFVFVAKVGISQPTWEESFSKVRRGTHRSFSLSLRPLCSHSRQLKTKTHEADHEAMLFTLWLATTSCKTYVKVPTSAVLHVRSTYPLTVRQPSDWTLFRARYCVDEKRSGEGWGATIGRSLAKFTSSSDFCHLLTESCFIAQESRCAVFVVPCGCLS